MRRFSAILAIATLTLIVPNLHAIHAQHIRTSSIGVIGGLSLTSLTGKDAIGHIEHRARPLAGLTLVTSWSASMLGFEMDALYAAKGYRSTGTVSTFDFYSSYVEIPLLLRINLAPDFRLHPFLSVGIAPALRLDCSAEIAAPVGGGTRTCSELIAATQQEVGKTDVSGVVGGGVTTNAGALQLTLGTRFTRGFMSVIGDSDNFNQTLSFYVGLSRSAKGAIRASVGK